MHGPAYASHTYCIVCDCGCDFQGKVDSKMQREEVQGFVDQILNREGKANLEERRRRWREFLEEVEWRLIPTQAQKAREAKKIEKLEHLLQELKDIQKQQ